LLSTTASSKALLNIASCVRMTYWIFYSALLHQAILDRLGYQGFFIIEH